MVACYHTAPRLPPRKVVRTTQNASAKHQPVCRYRGTDTGHMANGVAGRSGSINAIHERHIAPTVNELQTHITLMQRVTSGLKSKLHPLPAVVDHVYPRHDTRDLLCRMSLQTLNLHISSRSSATTHPSSPAGRRTTERVRPDSAQDWLNHNSVDFIAAPVEHLDTR
jgi:hypothetical protein